MRDVARGTVLVVDDEEMIAGALRSFLELETPHRVLCFTTPSAALERMAQEPVHVVISDFMMPEMDGLVFLQQVRERFPHASRILLTGYADKQNAIRAINEVGLYHYLEKPWSNEQLKLVVRNGVERCALLSELAERVGALEVANRELHDLHQRIIQAFL